MDDLFVSYLKLYENQTAVFEKYLTNDNFPYVYVYKVQNAAA